MVSKAYRTCLLLIEKMVKHNCIDQISKAELEDLIVRHIGADPRTIKNYVSVCVRFKFIEALVWKKDEVMVYAVNLGKAAHEFRRVFGKPMMQLTLPEAKS